MNQIVTRGIVLRRTDYGEADRIVVFLTPDHGKVSLMAKGVRRLKSKLAGGIEFFSVSSITFRLGRTELGTLMSSRLEHYYGEITKDIDRLQLAYELMRILNKITEVDTEPAHFDLLRDMFAAINDPTIDLRLAEAWFYAQLLRLEGQIPNLVTDDVGKDLDPTTRYQLSIEDSVLHVQPDGPIGADQIKFLRLLCSPNQPKTLQQVQGIGDLLAVCAPLVRGLLYQNVNV